jgi:hypothetical protein
MSLNSQNKGTSVFCRKDAAIAPRNGFDHCINGSNPPYPHDAPGVNSGYNKKRNNWSDSSAAPGASSAFVGSSPAPGSHIRVSDTNFDHNKKRNNVSNPAPGGFNGAPGTHFDYNKKRNNWSNGNQRNQGPGKYQNQNSGYNNKRNNGLNNGVQAGSIVSASGDVMNWTPNTDVRKTDARNGNRNQVRTPADYMPLNANVVQHPNSRYRGNGAQRNPVRTSAYCMPPNANMFQHPNSQSKGNGAQRANPVRTSVYCLPQTNAKQNPHQNQYRNNQQANQGRQHASVSSSSSSSQNQDIDMNRPTEINKGRNFNQGPRNFNQNNHIIHHSQKFKRGNNHRGDRQNFNKVVSVNPFRNADDIDMLDALAYKNKSKSNNMNQPPKFQRAFRDIGIDIEMTDAPSDEPVRQPPNPFIIYKPNVTTPFGPPSAQFTDYYQSDIEMVDAPPLIDLVSEIQDYTIFTPWHRHALSTWANQPRSRQRVKAFAQGAQALKQLVRANSYYFCRCDCGDCMDID